MSSIGPELPPHLLAKRKRQAEQQPVESETVEEKAPGSPNGDKRRRVMGPAMPPASLDELPRSPLQNEDESHSSDDDDDDDDGYGPSLHTGSHPDTPARADKVTDTPLPATQEPTTGRDAWMMMPPKQDDLAARMDPMKQRARGFNAGRAATAAAPGADNGMWTESPEQKRKRLENEVLGIAAPTAATAATKTKKRKDEETSRRLKEQIDTQRGKSLYERHQDSKPQEREDDPSKRAFDREKDMAIGSKIGHSQRKEMLNRASDFNSKFAAGSFL